MNKRLLLPALGFLAMGDACLIIDNPTTGLAPGVGAAPIPTLDHDVNRDLITTGQITPANTNDVVGKFRFICRHTDLKRVDHIVFLGDMMSPHLHDQTGVFNWDANSTYGKLRMYGGGSGCNDVAGQDHNPAETNFAANRTPYVQPAMLDGKGNAILADFIQVYYSARPNTDPYVSDPSNSHYEGKAVPLPNGLKFDYGANALNPSAPVAHPFKWSCWQPKTGSNAEMSFAAAVQCAKDNSATGAQLEAHNTSPECWNGSQLDSADHRSHLAYPAYFNGVLKCDSAHPFVIPAYTYGGFYTILPSDDGDIHLSSDEMDNSKPRGWSMHVGYGPAAWDPTVLAMWTDNCINRKLNCSAGDLGNGKQLKGAAVPIYYSNGVWASSWHNPHRLVPVQ